MEWYRSCPVCVVADVAASIAWYERVLGFEARIVNPPDDPVPVYAVLYLDRVVIHLMRKDEAPHGLGAATETQFWVDGEIDRLFAHVRASGARMVQTLAEQPWGQRDFMVADPDGNIVWVTQPVATGDAAG